MFAEALMLLMARVGLLYQLPAHDFHRVLFVIGCLFLVGDAVDNEDVLEFC